MILGHFDIKVNYMKIVDIKGTCQADPYVIYFNNKFYMYCTGVEGVQCYSSQHIDKGWQYVGIVLTQQGCKEYWAPCVFEQDGTFYMYYSSMPTNCDDVHQQQIKVATSSSPMGPFAFVKELLPPFSIDPHVVKNDSGLYMFYSVNDYNAQRAGTYIVCDKMVDFFEMQNQPKAMVVPTLDEEIFQKDRFVQGQHWHTIEGAFYFFKDGYHYCMYSGNCYEKPTYHIGYAVSNQPFDNLNQLDFDKHVQLPFEPLIATNDTETSTGHNSMIVADDVMYVVYHGRDLSDGTCNQPRTARICKLFVNNGKLTVERI